MKAIRDCARETGDKGLDSNTHTHAKNLHALENKTGFPILSSIQFSNSLMLMSSNI